MSGATTTLVIGIRTDQALSDLARLQSGLDSFKSSFNNIGGQAKNPLAQMPDEMGQAMRTAAANVRSEGAKVVREAEDIGISAGKKLRAAISEGAKEGNVSIRLSGVIDPAVARERIDAARISAAADKEAIARARELDSIQKEAAAHRRSELLEIANLQDKQARGNLKQIPWGSTTEQLAAKRADSMFAFRAMAPAEGSAEALRVAAKAAEGATTSFKVFGRELHLTGTAFREITVLIHEFMSGYMSRMPGSLISLSSYIGLPGKLVLGYIAAIGATVGVLALLFKAIDDGKHEMDAMNRAIAATGDYAGVTRGSMRGLAEQMSQTSRLTVGESKEVVTALVASGRIGAQALETVAKSAGGYAKVIGKDAKEATADLIRLFADPVKGAEELNEVMHFLSTTEMQHIRNLEEQGRLGEAQSILADKFAGQMSRAKQNLSGLEVAWDSVRKLSSAAWDAMLGLGRDRTPQDRVKDLSARTDPGGMGGMGAMGMGAMGTAYARETPEQAKQRGYLLKIAQREADSAEMRAIEDAAESDKNRADNAANDVARGKSFAGKRLTIKNQLKEQENAVTTDPLQMEMRNQTIAALRTEAYILEGGEARAQGSFRLLKAKLGVEVEHLATQVKLGQVSELEGIREKSRLDMVKKRAEIALAERKPTAGDPRLQAEKTADINALEEERRGLGIKLVDDEAEYRDKEYLKSLEVMGDTLEKQGKIVEGFWYKWYAKTLPELREAAAQAKGGNSTKQEVLVGQGQAESERKLIADIRLRAQGELHKVQTKQNEATLASDNGTGPLYTPEVKLANQESSVKALQKYIDELRALKNESGLVSRQIEDLEEQQSKLKVKMAETWGQGGRSAMAEYLKSVGNAADQSKRLFSQAFVTIESTLTKFVMTGKLGFKGLASSLVEEFVNSRIKSSMGDAIKGMSSGTGMLGKLGEMLGVSSKGLGGVAEAAGKSSETAVLATAAAALDGSALALEGSSLSLEGSSLSLDGSSLSLDGSALSLDGAALSLEGAAWALSSAAAVGGSTSGIEGMADFIGPMMSAKGNVFDSAGLHAHINTVVSSPTLFRFANGGAMGLMGEAGPEAIMPLRRDSQGRLGVAAQGAGGGGSVNNIVVNVDASGGSVNGEGDGRELGQQLVAAVQSVLVKEKRPGGLLAS